MRCQFYASQKNLWFLRQTAAISNNAYNILKVEIHDGRDKIMFVKM